MQNEIKLSSEALNSLFALAKNGKDGRESVKSILNNSLNEGQKKALGQIMADPKRLREMLSSPEARALMEKLGGKKQGDSTDGPA